MKIASSQGWNRLKSGQHPTELFFSVHGQKGAVVWSFSTGVAPTGPYPSQSENGPLLEQCNIGYPASWGVVAHSELTEETAHEEDHLMESSCEFLDGRACVCNYSRSRAPEFMTAFACEGIPGVERLLIETYKTIYGEEPEE